MGLEGFDEGLQLEGAGVIVGYLLEGLGLVNGGDDFRDGFIGIVRVLLQKDLLDFPLLFGLQVAVLDLVELNPLLLPEQLVHQDLLLPEEKLRQLKTQKVGMDCLDHFRLDHITGIPIELVRVALNEDNLLFPFRRRELRLLRLNQVLKENHLGSPLLSEEVIDQGHSSAKQLGSP